jgi:two-component system, sensor histidine kinase and response regulator
MDTLRVLVVDDEPGMRHAVTRALRPYKVLLPEVEGEVRFEVDQAGSGEEALDLVGARLPDIMLLDHKMGGMSGLEVLDELHRRELDVLIIMITAFATLETAVRATKSGAFDFLAKPFTPEELRETIRKAAGHLVVQRQARKLAAEKRRVRFEFISVLGHELKAPLAAIEGYLNIIRDRALGADITAYDQVVQRCLVRGDGMRKLILDLLDMTRIESGEKRRELNRVDLREIARAALETVKPAADARQITLALHGEGPVPLTADRAELEIIFNNLLSNAVKYNRDGGRIDVRIPFDDSRVSISVSDTGIGLTAAESARLFADFVRIKNDKTRDILGSGLGLSLVKKLALMYGGDVAVTSQPDAGSTFTVVLQRDFKPPAIEHEPSRNPPVPSQHG